MKGGAAGRVELAPGYSISWLIQGGWQLARGHRPEPLDRAAVLARLRRRAEAGLTTFDCADIYGGVEELLGELLAALARDGLGPIEVHTKLVPDLDALPRLDRRYVEAVIDRSLARLGVERLDLVQLHWWDYGVPGWVEAAGWLADLRRAGKIRLLGATNFDAPHLAAILDAGIELATHQVQYSLLDRRPERTMVDFCRRRGIHLLAYGTLAGGFLSDRYLGAPEPAAPEADRSLTKYRLIIEECGGWPAFQELLAALAEVTGRHRVGIGEVAVRWALDRPGVAAAIVGVGREERPHAARAIARLRLDGEDRRRLAAVLERLPVPPGEVYALERDRGGRHGAIMRYDLNTLA